VIRRAAALCLLAAPPAALLVSPLAARPPQESEPPGLYAVAERLDGPRFFAVAMQIAAGGAEPPRFVSIASRQRFVSIAGPGARGAGTRPPAAPSVTRRELPSPSALQDGFDDAFGTEAGLAAAEPASQAAPSALQDGFDDAFGTEAGLAAAEPVSQAAPSALQDGFDDAFGTEAGLAAAEPASQAAPSALQDGFDDAFGDGGGFTFDGVAASQEGVSAGGAPEGALGPSARNAIPAVRERSPFDLGGSISVGAAYNFAQDSPGPREADYRGLSRLRLDADLQLDVELPLGTKARVSGRGFRDLSYAVKDRDEFTHEVLQVYESELELKDAYVEGTVGKSFDFRVGRQVLALGTSETLRVLDVLSPIDNREPGLVDLRDLRLPVAATQVSYFTGPVRFRGIAIHESRFDDTPPFGSDFFPFDQRPPGEIRPANGGSDTEYAAAVTARLASVDASLNFAQYFDDEPHLDNESGLLEHSRLTLYGASLDVPVGSAVLRGEVARVRGLEFFGARGDLSRSDVLLGIDYFGIRDSTVTLELVARKLHGYDDSIKLFPDAARENSFEGSLRYTGSYLNDRARLTALLIVQGQQAQDGTVFRVSLDYDVRDALTVTAGVLLFEEGDLPPFSAADDNDRVFVKIRYSF
jgi:hypothetical protein